MSATTASVIILAILALVAIISLVLFRQKAKLKMTGPGKTSLNFDGTNSPEAAIRARDLKSRKGGFTTKDETGRGADIEKVDVEKDIEITTKPNGPKA